MTDLSPITKTITVRIPPTKAFALFAEQMRTWWPLDQRHSVFLGQTDGVFVEGRIGGRVVERSKKGEESVWGTVTAWAPPSVFAMSWHPGRGPETAQQVTVTFSLVGDGATQVTLVHAGWEVLGAEAAETRKGYLGGWDFVFGERFARACS
jgi:hypothetical protein